MVRALKIKDHKGVKEVNLINLEKINILSGENNSGKSSILEGVNEVSKRSIGFLLKKEHFSELASIYRPLIKTSQPSAEEILETLRAFINGHNKQYLYKDSVITYGEEFSRLFVQINHRNYGGDYGFAGFFKQLVQEDKLKTCLIDPKRKIESRVQINTAAKLSTNGNNLLNHLFYLKNQEPHSQGNEAYIKIYDNFSKITDGAQFNVLPDENNHISLRFRTKGSQKWVGAEDCGLGLREILMIVSFVLSSEFNFIEIEEPENHLHPMFQRRLLEFIASAQNKQFLLSTHSNIFLDTSYVNRIFWVSYNGEVTVEERTNKATILNDLGYSTLDNLTSDLLILTEGPKDFSVIEEFLKKMEIWDKFDIRFWPLGGDIMSQLNPVFLKENYKLIALLDKDPGSKKQRNRFKKICKESGIDCFQLERYSLENYYTLNALRMVFRAQINPDLKEINHHSSLKSQISIDVKKNSRELAKNMTIEDILNTDLYDFLLNVKEILEKSTVGK